MKMDISKTKMIHRKRRCSKFAIGREDVRLFYLGTKRAWERQLPCQGYSYEKEIYI